MKTEIKKDERFEKIKDIINDYVGDSSYVECWNAYCDESLQSEDMVYYMADIDDIFGKQYPSEIFQRLDDTFNWNDEYFYVDRNGYLVSTDFPKEDIIDEDEIIAYMIEHDEDLGYSEIRKILDGNFDEDSED